MRSLQSTGRQRGLPESVDLLSRFDHFFNDMQRELLRGNRLGDDRKLQEQFSPAADIEESEGMYLISLDLPGIKSENVKVDVHDRTLHIHGERNRDSKNEASAYCQRSYGRFERRFLLPEAVEPKSIEAHFEDGVLRVLLPKAEVQATHEIKVQSGKPQGFIQRLLHNEKDVPAPGSGDVNVNLKN